MTSSKKLKELFEINFFSQSEFTQYLVKPMLRNKKGNIAGERPGRSPNVLDTPTLRQLNDNTASLTKLSQSMDKLAKALEKTQTTLAGTKVAKDALVAVIAKEIGPNQSLA